jgi:hypothetical protein
MDEIEASTAAWTLFFMRNSELDRKSATALSRGELMRKRENDMIVPSGLRRLIGPYSELFEKQLTVADTKSDQGRLFIKRQFAKTSLLPLLNKDENPVDGVGVTVYDPNGKECKMMFKFWASKYYVLTQGWTAFCRDHDISDKDVVKLRMFRHLETRRLCFVISTVKATN